MMGKNESFNFTREFDQRQRVYVAQMRENLLSESARGGAREQRWGENEKT